MFGFFTRRRKPANKPAFHRARLHLEHLETRDCPAAPVISTFFVAPLPGHKALLAGTVTDDSFANIYVQFSGVISGTTYTDKAGEFFLVAQGSIPGEID